MSRSFAGHRHTERAVVAVAAVGGSSCCRMLLLGQVCGEVGLVPGSSWRQQTLRSNVSQVSLEVHRSRLICMDVFPSKASELLPKLIVRLFMLSNPSYIGCSRTFRIGSSRVSSSAAVQVSLSIDLKSCSNSSLHRKCPSRRLVESQEMPARDASQRRLNEWDDSRAGPQRSAASAGSG